MGDLNDSTKKIPYDDSPIIRQGAQKTTAKKNIGIKVFSVCFIALIVLNIALCITCYTYLQNGKIRIVNIYNDKFSSQEAVYLTDTMRTAKYHSVCVAAGLTQSGLASIMPNSNLSNSEFFHKTKSHGAGFLYKIIGNSAYFVTCYHVINYDNDENTLSSTRIWVLPASMLVPIEVELVSYSAKDDVAVLKYTHNDILETLEGCTPVSCYDSTFLTEYEDVFTIGNPLNYGFTGTSGKLTAYRQYYYDSQEKQEYYWLKTDAAINPGNSGGALYNADGEFIGMVNANIPESATGAPVSNTAYAIPGTLVCSIADNIIENNLNMTKPNAINVGIIFGVDEIRGVDRYKAKYKDQYGNYKDLDQQYVIVKDFESSSIAESQGLKKGDRIVSIDIELYGNDDVMTIPILNVFTYYEYAYGIKPSSIIKFNIERQNEKNETIEHSVFVRAIKY